MFISSFSFVVIFEENFIEDILPTVSIPDLELLSKEIYSLVH